MIKDLAIGTAVEVHVHDPKTSKTVWRKGVVTGTGMMYPSEGCRHKPYPKVKIKYTHTYWKQGVYADIGKYYDKENEALFINEKEVRVLNENKRTN